MNLPVKGHIKPFLRWAGGKTWLLKHFKKLVDLPNYNNYHEPFLGSGAIFFALNPQNNAYLVDLNPELIEAYTCLRDEPLAVIEKLAAHKNTKEYYYYIRESSYKDVISRAARFIFLNQTSFNGIYRVNLNGKYNVPYGYRKKPFLEQDKLLAASERLKKANILCGDFSLNIKHITKGDLVFLDPPYTVSHNDNGFIKYNQKLFSLEDQKRLSIFIDCIKEKEAYYILTNAAHKTIAEIFDKHDRCIKLSRASLIGGENAKREQVSEYIFTNIRGVEN